MPEPSTALKEEDLVPLLATAIADWVERAPRSEEITRVVLLHDWPVNPPFPPALVARGGDAFAPGDDPWAFFEPEPGVDAWFAAGARELRTPELRALTTALNAWFPGDDESERSPLPLFIEIAQATRHEVAERTGRDVVVIPLDMGWLDVAAAVTALLPPETAAAIIAAFEATPEG